LIFFVSRIPERDSLNNHLDASQKKRCQRCTQHETKYRLEIVRWQRVILIFERVGALVIFDQMSDTFGHRYSPRWVFLLWQLLQSDCKFEGARFSSG
jgi:hypothetical protein